MQIWQLAVLGTYGACAAALSLFGAHRAGLTASFWWRWSERPEPRMTSTWPAVTIQLPVFNERDVVGRLVDHACKLSYPGPLQIQVLDDSTDDTTERAMQAVERWQAQGVDIQLHHREDRQGFKAGALQDAMPLVRGEFIAIFDADFLPPHDFLLRAMPHFGPGVGMVQARWGHANDHASLLTRLEAVLLDGHFVIEHTARHRSGRWFNFNGTAGIWRRETIESAGGWQHDTLTEDLDLSYRAQLQGWRFVYLPQVVVPAELPPSLRAFKSQQHRWAKGSIQTLLKLGPTLARAPIPLRVKAEALLHLSNNLAYPPLVLLTLLTPLAVWIRGQEDVPMAWLDLPFFLLATVGVLFFYGSSQLAVYRDWPRRLLRIPGVMALGMGMAINQSRAVIEALRGQRSPFVRTPKAGDAERSSYRMPGHWSVVLEAGLALYHLVGVLLAFDLSYWPALGLQALLLSGFWGVAWFSFRPGAGAGRGAPPPASPHPASTAPTAPRSRAPSAPERAHSPPPAADSERPASPA
ncbi:MAG: glycosyltransferase [Myxococcota bacterium]|nr:glycosyltransferase [Myxococcota bacterium]